ncbi:MAG TPA: CRISPR system precrRNA processing endoribonuclease RAMP protein Cas6 [Deltaproteobacteria bacterium]|nr:CRISPR system precrRNA processing endoribonuclease RAMP protein Cas6 [Deltaproteobacteria bacterium]HQB37800.1 CRISPR system precrRNA processing endoribonuclease RAMP protein Cas6 [Deltaproteobacteria bacterium]
MTTPPTDVYSPAFPGFTAYRLRFSLTVTEDIILPPYKGFTFRGVFGTVLRELACSIPGEKCPLCPFRHTCAYGYLFETVPDASVPHAGKFAAYPRPYIINPPLTARHRFGRYESMTFETVLIGRSVEFLPHLVMTFEEIGRRGIRNGRGRYLIDRITATGPAGRQQTVWEKGLIKGTCLSVRWDELAEPASADSATLEFITPLLVEDHGRPLETAPDFGFLMNALAHRASLLHQLHGHTSAAEAEQHNDGSHGISIAVSTLKWHDFERVSSRQQKRLRTGGMLGRVTYSGGLTPGQLQLLRLGELIHIGKSTTFGFGGYRLYIN